jgi:hypothetical protein
MRRMHTVVVTALVLLVPAPAATAGVISSTGWTASTTTPNYISIHPDKYGGRWWTVSITDQVPSTIGSGYTETDVRDGGAPPGKCMDRTGGRTEWWCGLVGGTSGEPFLIRGTDGPNVVFDVGCFGLADWLPPGSACPRSFKIDLAGGADLLRLSTDLPMNRTEVSGGAGNDSVFVSPGPANGRIELGLGDDAVDTSRSSGPWTIVCGPGLDTVNPGPNDTVSKDCERRGAADDPRAPTDPTPPAVKNDYSLAGVCGLKKKTKATPRCYVMLGGGLIRAIKSNEDRIASSVASVAARATAHAVDDIAKQLAKKTAVKQAKNRLITFSVRKIAGELAAKGLTAGTRGFTFGTLLGKATTAGIIATRWSHLEAKGYPRKCFLVQLTYGDGKPKLALDPIFSFVRSWDHTDPPSYRGKSTSMGRWEKSSGKGATLPLFCGTANAVAATLPTSEGLSSLLSPPYVRFSIVYDH